jgi:hypothetical protein
MGLGVGQGWRWTSSREVIGAQDWETLLDWNRDVQKNQDAAMVEQRVSGASGDYIG